MMPVQLSTDSLKVGVYGSWRDDTIASKTLEWAHALGYVIATQGHVLVTGGSGGVLLEARRGSKEAGGLNIGILPENRSSDDVEKRTLIDIAIPTGQGALGRMAILTQTVDLAFAVGGGGGTLVEVTMTCLQRKPMVVIDRLQRTHDPDFRRLLSRSTELCVNGVVVMEGWIDSKSSDMISPVYVIDSTVGAQQAMLATLALFNRTGFRSKIASGGPLDE